VVASAGTRLALPIFGRLAYAYLARGGQGDDLRAAFVLRKLSQVYPSLLADFRRELVENGYTTASTATFGSSIPDTWTGDTPTIIALAIQGATSPATPTWNAADQLHDATLATLPRVARSVVDVTPSSAPVREYILPVAAASPSAIGTTLDALIAQTRAAAAATTPRASDPRPAPAPAIVPHATTLDLGPAGVITARPPTSTAAPTWPWWVLGGVVAIGLGVFAYQRITHPHGASE
jgi:hypothetical protein